MARLVVSSTPMNLPFVYPETGKASDIAAAERRNRAVIRASTLDNWLPAYRVHDAVTGRTTTNSLLGCPRVRHPAEFSGLGLLSVLTLDLAQGIEPVDTDAVMAGGEMVYASTQSLYVATQQWVGPAELDDPSTTPPAVTTAIHKFDISSPAETEYRGSGRVTGYLLNQWSLSEQNGFLRVVSTDAPSWWGGEESETESMVTVMVDQDGRLATVGRLSGLGLGERVYAVRFIGDLGYVVTFRQVDPLHVVDVSDPSNPVLRGSSAHPRLLRLPPSDRRAASLLGIGQDATSDGRVLGTQASVFDVTSPRQPGAPAQAAARRRGTNGRSSTPGRANQPARVSLEMLPARGTDTRSLIPMSSSAVRSSRRSSTRASRLCGLRSCRTRRSVMAVGVTSCQQPTPAVKLAGSSTPSLRPSSTLHPRRRYPSRSGRTNVLRLAAAPCTRASGPGRPRAPPPSRRPRASGAAGRRPPSPAV